MTDWTMEDGLDILIADLRHLKGAAFWQQLALIANRPEFKQIEAGIYSAISLQSPDFEHLLDAARKAVSFGYTVYILPNPKGVKSADFIFKRKGIYHLYELKTIYGKHSVGNRLLEASSQSNRVLLSFTKKYNPRLLAKELIQLFHSDKAMVEVLIFYKGKQFLVKRRSVNPSLIKRLINIMR